MLRSTCKLWFENICSTLLGVKLLTVKHVFKIRKFKFVFVEVWKYAGKLCNARSFERNDGGTGEGLPEHDTSYDGGYEK